MVIELTKDRLIRRLLKVVNQEDLDIILEDFYGGCIGTDTYEDFHDWIDENVGIEV